MSDFSSRSIIISCDSCIMQHTAACADCVVSHVLSPAPAEGEHEGVVLSMAEARAVDLLVAAGMLPTLRHREAS